MLGHHPSEIDQLSAQLKDSVTTEVNTFTRLPLCLLPTVTMARYDRLMLLHAVNHRFVQRCIMSYLSLRCSCMAHVNEGSPATHSTRLIHKWNEPYLPLLLNCRASPQYSFPLPLSIGGKVGLGGWLDAEVVCSPKDGHTSQY